MVDVWSLVGISSEVSSPPSLGVCTTLSMAAARWIIGQVSRLGPPSLPAPVLTAVSPSPASSPLPVSAVSVAQPTLEPTQVSADASANDPVGHSASDATLREARRFPQARRAQSQASWRYLREQVLSRCHLVPRVPLQLHTPTQLAGRRRKSDICLANASARL